MNKLFLIILLMSTICSCNPINRIKKDISKSEQAKANLAKLCSEQFPVLPISFTPGSVDTNQIINSILGSLDKLCPEYRPQEIPNNIDTQHKAVAEQSLVSNIKGNTLQTNQHFKDSLIAAIKKAFQPDVKIVKDSAELVALRNDNKQLLATNTDLVAQHATDQHFKDLARTRLWMFIAVCVALVASNGFWIYSKFKV